MISKGEDQKGDIKDIDDASHKQGSEEEKRYS